MKARDYIDDKISNNPKDWKGLRNMSVEDVAELMEEYAKAINKNSVIPDVSKCSACGIEIEHKGECEVCYCRGLEAYEK